MDQEEFNGNAIPADQDINAQVSNDAAASSDVHSMQPVDEVAVQTADEAPFDTDAPVGLTEEPVELTENSAELVEEPADSPAEAIEDGDLDEAKAAWENAENAAQPTENDPQAVTAEDIERASELAEPFVGMWNKLISTTNWEKGKIISEWRAKLIASGVDATQYSDEAWSKRVGGVTSPHVGRLRRVYERFNDSYQSYEGLYWSHFLAALDWEDAPLWLEGATKEKWSISAMRESRWKAEGAVESNRPTLAKWSKLTWMRMSPNPPSKVKRKKAAKVASMTTKAHPPPPARLSKAPISARKKSCKRWPGKHHPHLAARPR